MKIQFQCPQCGVTIEGRAKIAGRTIKCPGCQADVHVSDRRIGPGTVVGGFLIERFIARGGMGEMYVARQLSMDRQVALKILPPQFAANEEEIERFLQEVRLLAKLDHPNIVSAFEAGHDEDAYFLAMSFVEGEDLARKLLRDGPMPEQPALQIVRRVAAALAYAWTDHRIVHRDIKPSNIMVDVHGEVRLTDLGLSKSARDTSGLTVSGAVMGTPNYMSPEQAQGSAETDFRADMYSLGATLYHMLTGKLPFEASSPLHTLRMLGTEQLADPRQSRPAISENTVRLMEVMLAREPVNRYQDWGTLLTDLDRAIQGESLVHKVPEPGQSVLRRDKVAGAAPATPRRSTAPQQPAAHVRMPTPGPRPSAPANRRTSRNPAAGIVVGILVAAGIGAAVVVAVKQAQPPPRQVAVRQPMEIEPVRHVPMDKTTTPTTPAPTPPKSSDPRYAELEGMVNKAMADVRANPTALEENIRTLELLSISTSGTALQSRVMAEAERLKRELDRLAQTEMAAIRSQCETLAAKADYDGALQYLSGYSGPFVRATAALRETHANDIRAKVAAIQADQTTAAQAVDALVATGKAEIAGLATCLRNEDFVSGRKLATRILGGLTAARARCQTADAGKLDAAIGTLRGHMSDVDLLERMHSKGTADYENGLIGKTLTLGPVRGVVVRVENGKVVLLNGKVELEQPLPPLELARAISQAAGTCTNATAVLRANFLLAWVTGDGTRAWQLLPDLQRVAPADAARYESVVQGMREAAATQQKDESIAQARQMMAAAQEAFRRTGASAAGKLMDDIRARCGDGDAFAAIRDDFQSLSAAINASASAVDVWRMKRGNALGVGRARVRGPSEPATRWTLPIGAYGACPVIGSDGTIHVCPGDRVVAVKPDGREKWSLQVGKPQTTMAVGADGSVYLCANWQLVSLHPAGTKRWATDSYASCGGLLLGPDGSLYAVGNSPQRRCALHAFTAQGTRKWTYEMEGEIGPNDLPPGAAMSPGGDTLYVGDAAGNLHAVSADGQKKWQTRLDDGWVHAPVVHPTESVLVATRNRFLCCLGSDGALRWRTSSPARLGELLLSACGSSCGVQENGTVFAAEPDGTPKWEFRDERRELSNPLIDGEDTVYVCASHPGAEDARLIALAPNGQAKWQHPVKTGRVVWMAAGADGTLYLAGGKALAAVGDARRRP